MLLLIYLDPLSVLCPATGGKKVKHKAIEKKTFVWWEFRLKLRIMKPQSPLRK